jgi:methyl-accepting chemotaxis protein
MADTLQVFKEALIAKKPPMRLPPRRGSQDRARPGRRHHQQFRSHDRRDRADRVVGFDAARSRGTLSSTAERSQQLTTAVAAAEEASTNVQSVASATEELSSSVNNRRQVQESARMATDAVGQARVTNERVSEVSKAASRIGDVVELISTIAGQTNLLALNATIEARAPVTPARLCRSLHRK